MASITNGFQNSFCSLFCYLKQLLWWIYQVLVISIAFTVYFRKSEEPWLTYICVNSTSRYRTQREKKKDWWPFFIFIFWEKKHFLLSNTVLKIKQSHTFYWKSKTFFFYVGVYNFQVDFFFLLIFPSSSPFNLPYFFFPHYFLSLQNFGEMDIQHEFG